MLSSMQRKIVIFNFWLLLLKQVYGHTLLARCGDQIKTETEEVVTKLITVSNLLLEVVSNGGEDVLIDE